MENLILAKKYKILRRVGEGSFAQVMRATNILNDQKVAIKIEKVSRYYNIEAEVLAKLRGKEGFPLFFEKFELEGFNYTVMELLGETLHDLKKKYSGKFSLSTVISIGLQVLERLKSLHSSGYIHRDLKPQQFLVGKKDKERVYMVDFGMCKKFRLASIHIPFQTNCPKAGNATFASINIHRRIQASRRDDMESFAYLLIYCIKGKLPWQNIPNTTKIDKWVKIGAAKAKVTTEQLCDQLPNEFKVITNYCKSLEFDETPNYDLLINILVNLTKKLNLTMEIDWMSKLTRRASKPPTVLQEAESTYESVHLNSRKSQKQTSNTYISKCTEVEIPQEPNIRDQDLHINSFTENILEAEVLPPKRQHSVKFEIKSESESESDFESEHESKSESQDFGALETTPNEAMKLILLRRETIIGHLPVILDRNKFKNSKSLNKESSDSKYCPMF